MEAVRKLVWAVAGYVASLLCFMGYYPLVPALYGTYCMDETRNIFLYGGILVGIGMNMPVITSVKYVFIIIVICIGIKFYKWANGQCNGLAGGVITGGCVMAMNLAGASVGGFDWTTAVLGIAEGLIVAGGTMAIHFALDLSKEAVFYKDEKIITPAEYVADGRLNALSNAVGGLSDAFSIMACPRTKSQIDEINLLQQEVIGNVCGECASCRQCTEGLRRLLDSVMNHVPYVELVGSKYIACSKYERVVEAAVEAFGRLELNESWYKRLLENRMVIARQFDVMEELLLNWQEKEKNIDARSKLKKSRIIYEAKEVGARILDIHMSQDESNYLKLRMQVESSSGTTSRRLLSAVEKALNMDMRLKGDTPSIISKEPVDIIIYEDTSFYILTGVATQKKNGSSVSGDSFSMFELDRGSYNICLSDGMGSGSGASRESEMVVELLQRFMEAGFNQQAAVKMMNAAMVLKGEEGSYSTLDHAVVNLHTGDLEMVKIGASATFIKRQHEVEYIKSESLPAGVDMEQTVEIVKKSLRHGEFLVMVTDGVLEYLHVNNPEEVLSDVIGEMNTENAGAMARRILDKVLSFTGGYALDDMTVLAAGIWEK